MIVSIVVAQAHNGVIGKSNDLPWYAPADLKHFKELTTGHTVIMGRKTYESILARLGKPLPNRQNIVITRDDSFDASGAVVAHALDEALAAAQSEEVFIIGGAQIYELALPYADKLYITEIHADIDGDTYFPTLEPDKWQETERELHSKDEKNQFDYAFVTLERSDKS